MNHLKKKKYAQQYADLIKEGKTEEEVLKSIQSDEEDFTDEEAKEIYAEAQKYAIPPDGEPEAEDKPADIPVGQQQTPTPALPELEGKHQRYEKWRIEATDVTGNDQASERKFRFDFVKKLRPYKDMPESYIVDTPRAIELLNSQAHNTLIYYTAPGTESGSEIFVTIK